MKKKIILILAIIVIIAGCFIIKNKKQSKFNYEIEKITEYNYFIYKNQSEYGVIDKTGKTIIDAQYTKIIIPNPEKDIFECYNDEDKKILNSSGQALFTEYESVEPIKLKNVASALAYEKSTLMYKKDGLYGLIDFNGKIITKNTYDRIENLQPTEGKFLVSKDNKYGVIDLKGNVLVNLEYDNILSDGYYTKQDDYKKSGFITEVKTNDGVRYGYISFSGKEILANKYNELNRIQKEAKNIYLIASENGRFGLYKNSKKIIENKYQGISYDDSTDVLILQKNIKYGVASLEGKIIIDVQNDEVASRGIYLYAKNSNENKVYDTQGNVVDMNYNRSIYETDNPDYRISTILNNDITYYGIIDKNGNQLVGENYRYIEYLYGNYFIATNEEGNLGVINNNGRTILDMKYNSMQKIKGKNILQAIKQGSKTTEFYSENMEKVAEVQNANVKTGEDFVIISNGEKNIYLSNSGSIIEDTSNLKNTTFPDKIGEYKKEQITIENVYYIKE